MAGKGHSSVGLIHRCRLTPSLTSRDRPDIVREISLGDNVSSQKQSQDRRHRAMQVLLALFSFIFVTIVAYGYYHLLTDFGWFIAFVLGVVIAAIAWLLARVAGTGEGGLKKNWILIVPLFLISAAGVYNSMMVYLEGGQVLADSTSGAMQNFAVIERAANTQLEANGTIERINRVNSIRDALFSEIENPLNCGQGPEAMRLIGELQRELPNFTPLSSPSRDCSRNQAVIEDYRTRTDALVARAPWNDAELNSIASDANQGRATLADLQREIGRSYSPGNIQQISGILEGLQTDYQELLFRLEEKTDASDLPQNLDIAGAQSLGNIYELPALFFSRLDEVSTYAYLLIALGFDLFLVYLFHLTTSHRVRKYEIHDAILGAW